MIYLECKADQTLVQTLTRLTRREIIHALKGQSELIKRMSNTRDALGMVDADPEQYQPVYLSRMQTLKDMPDIGLKVLVDASRDNRVVVLCPRLEDWIVRAAQESNIALANPRYNLPNTAKRLHEAINIDLRKFERLLLDLADAPRLVSLREELQAP